MPKKTLVQKFGEKLERAIEARNYFRPKIGARKAAAEEAGVSPTRISEMIKGTFPNIPPEVLGEARQQKVIQGRTFTLIRVCLTFDLDLNSALKIFDLPKNKIWIAQVHKERTRQEKGLTLSNNDLDLLKTQCQRAGSVLYTSIPKLLEELRKDPV